MVLKHENWWVSSYSDKLSSVYNKKSKGIYRDDGLAVFKNLSGPESEKVKKTRTKMFKGYGLNITIQCNLKIINYLDIKQFYLQTLEQAS